MVRAYGNLLNRMMEHSVYAEPKVGQSVTEYVYSDRYVYHVTAVRTPQLIEVTQAQVVYGVDGYATSVTPGTGQPFLLRWSDRSNAWLASGGQSGSKFKVGVEDAYQDPTF